MTIRLKKDGNGYSYEVFDRGKLVAAGWSRGTKRDARETAAEAIAELKAKRGQG